MADGSHTHVTVEGSALHFCIDREQRNGNTGDEDETLEPQFVGLLPPTTFQQYHRICCHQRNLPSLQQNSHATALLGDTLGAPKDVC